jgi:5-methylcytosine-specific restriction endonuclease McrA
MTRQKRRNQTPEFMAWSLAVRERDKHTCQCCGSRQRNRRLYNVAHHIESWDINEDKRFLIDNGLTLCKRCHKKFHKTYGFGKNNSKQLEMFIEENKK